MSQIQQRRLGWDFGSWGKRREAAGRRRGRRPCLEFLESRRLLSGTSITPYPAPAGSYPTGITLGPDGNLWFTETDGNKIGMINPTSHATTESPLIPTANSLPTDITTGPDGNLWFTEFAGNKIGVYDPKTLAFRESQPLPAGAQPSGITVGPDGNLWFTESGINEIGMINPKTLAVTQSQPLPAGAQPSGIAVGPDGNLWFTESGINEIGMINPKTLAIGQFSVPTANSGPDKITTGPDGNLWFTEDNANKIGMINPTTGGSTDFPIGGAVSFPGGITVGPDGNLWFAEQGPFTDKIGVVSPATHLVVTAQPPAFVRPGSAFGLTVTVDYDSGLVDSGFNGPVTLALASNPGGATLGGTLTVTAKHGVATFSGLTLDQLGSGYRLMAYTDPLTTTLAGPVTVANPPEIVAEKVLFAGKGRHRHVIGFELDFSKLPDSTRAEAAANYAVTQTIRNHGKLVRRPVSVHAVYNSAADDVTLTLVGRARFVNGGQIVVNAQSPNGITDAAGEYLDGTGQGTPGVNGVFTIAPRASGITHS